MDLTIFRNNGKTIEDTRRPWGYVILELAGSQLAVLLDDHHAITMPFIHFYGSYVLYLSEVVTIDDFQLYIPWPNIRNLLFLYLRIIFTEKYVVQ